MDKGTALGTRRRDADDEKGVEDGTDAAAKKLGKLSISEEK